jgi:hypothetical protein
MRRQDLDPKKIDIVDFDIDIETDTERYGLFPIVSMEEKKIHSIDYLKKILKTASRNNTNQVGNISKKLLNTKEKIDAIKKVVIKTGYQGLLMHDCKDSITILAKIISQSFPCHLSIDTFIFFIEQTPEYLTLQEARTEKILLHRLCEFGKMRGCRIAIEHGASLAIRDRYGKKPIDCMKNPQKKQRLTIWLEQRKLEQQKNENND